MVMNTSTSPRRILFVGNVDLDTQPNHRFFHIVEHISREFDEAVFVSVHNLYGGPPTTFTRKVVASLHHLLTNRRWEWMNGSVHYWVVRKLKLPSFVEILFGDLWVYLNLPRRIVQQPYDVAIISHPHMAYAMVHLQRSGRIGRVFYDDCDFFPGHLDAKGLLASAVLAHKEKLAVRRADCVFSVTTSLAELRRRQGAAHVEVVPNGADLDIFQNQYYRHSKLPTLLYFGQLADAWGVDLALQALPLIAQEIPDIRLKIIGSGNYEDCLRQLAGELGVLARVEFLGRQRHEDLPQFISEADVGLATYKPRNFIHYASSLKVREYTAAGLPVIASRVGEATSLLEQSESGVLVEPTPAAIATAAVRMLQDQALRAISKLTQNVML